MMFRQPFSWNEMERLRRDFERLYDGTLPTVYRQRVRTFPAVNLWTKDSEGAIVTAELPGVDPGTINIAVTGDTLTISGFCQPSEKPESEQYHRQERNYREFNRAVQLPFAVDTGGVEATMEKGVLRIVLPRAEAEKPKQITVKSSA
jgi:HSP20 family protein